MTRSDVATLAAVARESANPTLPAEPGWCLRYCRLMAEIPPRYLTAYLSAIHADPQPGPPPLGSFVYWRNPPDSQGTAGHIAIADGAGNCYTTDLVRTGRFDLVPVGAIHSGWGLEYLGWSYTCNDVEIPHEQDHGAGGGEPLPPPDPEDWFDMATKAELEELLKPLATAGAQMRPVQVLGLPEIYAWDGQTMLHVYDPSKLNGLRATGALVATANDSATPAQFDTVVEQIKAWGRWTACGCASATCRLK